MTTKEQQRREKWEQVLSVPALQNFISTKTVEGHGVTKGVEVWHGSHHAAGVTVRAINHGPGLLAQLDRVAGGKDQAAPPTPLVVEANGGEVVHGSKPWHSYKITCQCQARLNPIAAHDLLQQWFEAEIRRGTGKLPRITLE